MLFIYVFFFQKMYSYNVITFHLQTQKTEPKLFNRNKSAFTKIINLELF